MFIVKIQEQFKYYSIWVILLILDMHNRILYISSA